MNAAMMVAAAVMRATRTESDMRHSIEKRSAVKITGTNSDGVKRESTHICACLEELIEVFALDLPVLGLGDRQLRLVILAPGES